MSPLKVAKTQHGPIASPYTENGKDYEVTLAAVIKATTQVAQEARGQGRNLYNGLTGAMSHGRKLAKQIGAEISPAMGEAVNDALRRPWITEVAASNGESVKGIRREALAAAGLTEVAQAEQIARKLHNFGKTRGYEDYAIGLDKDIKAHERGDRPLNPNKLACASEALAEGSRDLAFGQAEHRQETQLLGYEPMRYPAGPTIEEEVMKVQKEIFKRWRTVGVHEDSESGLPTTLNVVRRDTALERWPRNLKATVLLNATRGNNDTERPAHDAARCAEQSIKNTGAARAQAEAHTQRVMNQFGSDGLMRTDVM